MSWKTLAFVLVGVVVGAVLLARAGGAVSADAPVTVLTTQPVRVVLPIDAGAAHIQNRLGAALKASAGAETDRRMAAHLIALATDEETTSFIAEDGRRWLAGQTAAGVAYPLYDVTIGEREVVLYSVTVELLPQYYGVGTTQDHEDGHWMVNDAVASRCGPRIVKDEGSSSLFAAQAKIRILSALAQTGDRVHDEYHRLVVGANNGQHRAAALNAVETTLGLSCERMP